VRRADAVGAGQRVGYQPATSPTGYRWFASRDTTPPASAALAATGGLGLMRVVIEGRRLFERDTFGGNGRTWETCHSEDTGTVSPQDARKRFRRTHRDPLFVDDATDDEDGDGVGDNTHATRMLADATILVRLPLHPNVTLKDDPDARVVTVPRGIATTLNTPALDPVLMVDGRQPDLESQALGAIPDHAQGTRPAQRRELESIARFQQFAPRFFTSRALEVFSLGGPKPRLPQRRTAAEKRGRTFFRA
jgi:hypothetical protein